MSRLNDELEAQARKRAEDMAELQGREVGDQELGRTVDAVNTECDLLADALVTVWEVAGSPVHGAIARCIRATFQHSPRLRNHEQLSKLREGIS